MPEGSIDITGSGNFAASGVSNSIINASIVIGKSGEYRELKDHLNTLQKLFDKTSEDETQERLELSEKINEQKAFLESFKQDVLKLAETFDKIELNTERLQKAKEHFDKGEITEARMLLEVGEEERADFVSRALDKQKEYQENVLPGLQNAAAEYLILAQATALDFENPNRFEDACRYYKQSVEAYSSFDNLFDYARFLQEHLQYKEAVVLYEKIKMEFGPGLSRENYGMTLNNIAVLHQNRNGYKAAEEEYTEALALYQELAKKNPQAFLPDVAMTLNNLAVLYSDLNEFEAAEGEFTQALAIYRELAEKNPQEYLLYLAGTLNNLANLHRNRNKFKAAVGELKEALTTYRELAEKNPQKYLLYLAGTLDNLANLHVDLNEFEVAEAGFTEALMIRRGLAEKNPQAHLPDVATTLNNLAILHRARNEYEPAETEYMEALAVRRELAKKNPQAFDIDVAQTLYNFAFFYHAINKPRRMKESLEEAAQILEKYAEGVPYIRKYLEVVREELEKLKNTAE